MTHSILRDKLARLVEQWNVDGTPSKYAFEFIASDLAEWKDVNAVSSGLWRVAPTMLTATLDDFVGQGIETIEFFARFAGVEVTPLGVMQPAPVIVEECRNHCPTFLGLTVLRTFVLEDLIYIGRSIPAGTLLLVGGGPFLQSEPDIAAQANLHLVAKDVKEFIEFLLNFQPQ